jgi:hypothetical protein
MSDTQEIQLSPRGKQLVREILKHLERAEAAFGQLSDTDNHACFDWHREHSTLNHCLRWGTQAAREISESGQ